MKDMRPGAVLACMMLLVAGVLGISKVANRDRCFQYDVTVESSTICGTPRGIEVEQHRRGQEMAKSAAGVLADPIGMCLKRADAQAEMHDWPDRYRRAYADGCKDQPTTTGVKK